MTFLNFVTFLAALAVAAVSGWFSIVGIMTIYAGAPFNAALILGIVTEFAKLVTISWLYRNWKLESWKLRLPLSYFVVALMLITSIGVYGFLTKAHLEQGAATLDNTAKVEQIEQQIIREKSVITDNEKVISQLDATVNSYISKDRTDRSVAIRRSQDKQRKQLRAEIDAANDKITTFNAEKFTLESEVRAIELEVGPIKYIADLIHSADVSAREKVESAVKIFTLLVVSTLDPLAVMLLMAANATYLRRKNEEKEEESKRLCAGKAETSLPSVEETSTPSTEVSLPVWEIDKGQSASIPQRITVPNSSHQEQPVAVPSENDTEVPLDGKISKEIQDDLNEEEITRVEISAGQASMWTPTVDATENESNSEFIPGNISAAPTRILERPEILEILENEVDNPLPIIRSPGPSRVIKHKTDIPKTYDPQDPIRREILGTTHSNSGKVNEENIEVVTTYQDSTTPPALSSNTDSDTQHAVQKKRLLAEIGEEPHEGIMGNGGINVLSWIKDYKKGNYGK